MDSRFYGVGRNIGYLGEGRKAVGVLGSIVGGRSVEVLSNLVVGGGLFGVIAMLIKTFLDHKRGLDSDMVSGYSGLYELTRNERDEAKAENRELRDRIDVLEQHLRECDGKTAELLTKVEALENAIR